MIWWFFWYNTPHELNKRKNGRLKVHFLIKMVLFYCHISFWMFLGVYSFFLANPRWWLDNLRFFSQTVPEIAEKDCPKCQNPRWLYKMIGQLQPNPRWWLVPEVVSKVSKSHCHSNAEMFFFAALVNQCSCREHPFNWICIRSILNIMCLFLPQSSKYLQRRLFRYVLGVCTHPHKVFGSLGLILHICNNEKSIVAQILPIFKLEMHLWSTFSQKIIRPLYTLLVYIYIYPYLIVYI